MLAVALVNHLIQQNPELQAALAGFGGRVFLLQAAAWSMQAQVDEAGFLRESNEAPETTLAFHTSAMQKIAQGHTPGVADVTVSGDHGLGMALLPLLGGLRYHAHDDLSRLFGDALAGSISTRAERLGTSFKEMRHSLLAEISDYAREQNAPVLHRQDFQPWSDEVDRLRDDTARLQARLAKLTQSS